MINIIISQKRKHQPKDGIIVFIFNKNRKKIILLKRRDIPVFVAPGGGVEKGESPRKAAIRECFEETGCKVKIIRHVATYYYSDQNNKLYLFEAKYLSGKLSTGPETKEISFYSLNDLPKLTHPLVDERLSDILTNSKKVIYRQTRLLQPREIIFHFINHPILITRYLLTRIGIHINT